MKVLVAQLNPKVGDIDGNLRGILRIMGSAHRRGADLVVFPEMAVCGYPPKDLLLREGFAGRCAEAVGRLASECRGGLCAVVGTVAPNPGPGPPLLNVAAVLADGGVLRLCPKRLLPSYDVFDERRYFAPGGEACVVPVLGRRVGVTVCEDAWGSAAAAGPFMPPGVRYGIDPVALAVRAGADVVVNVSASPFSAGKQAAREVLMASHADSLGVPVVYANQVGANDDLVFDGSSAVFAPGRGAVARAPAFEECALLADVDSGESLGLARWRGAADGGRFTVWTGGMSPHLEEVESVWRALVLGVRDYYRKTGIFGGAVIGLSGGIDSAVTAAVAVEALGAGAVHGVYMPSRWSSAHSRADAEALAAGLGIELRDVPIHGLVSAAESALAPSFAGLPPGVAEENVQARARGVVLMALSNKFGWLLLTTGNKSELAVGYCTLYGDMCGGLAVLSDVPKGMVYRLAAGRAGIPRGSIEKPPSAELRPGQVDQDTLPPYPVLDAILEAYVEGGRAPASIAAGLPLDAAAWVPGVAAMVDRSEYKRRQAAPGLRVTTRAFGHGWRMPIAAASPWTAIAPRSCP